MQFEYTITHLYLKHQVFGHRYAELIELLVSCTYMLIFFKKTKLATTFQDVVCWKRNVCDKHYFCYLCTEIAQLVLIMLFSQATNKSESGLCNAVQHDIYVWHVADQIALAYITAKDIKTQEAVN